MAIGIAIGVLIGAITGVVALVLLKTANTAAMGNVAGLVALTSELLAIPTFWFGGPWIATDLLALVELATMINPYIITLALVFVTFLAYPVFRWVIQLGNELGSEG